jgi:transposase
MARRRKPSESTVVPLSVREFFERFPDNDACLEHVMEVRYGLRHTCQHCGVVNATFHRLRERPAYSCAHCGAHVHPCAGTIFQDTRTPLQMWFYAIYLFVTTRHGVSGKELQRTLGVTYKTAYRIGRQIRDLMIEANGFKLMQGHIEMDEAYVGGHHPGIVGRGALGKTIVLGIKERGGRMVAEVIPDAKERTIRQHVRHYVKEGSTVSTDEYVSYRLLKKAGYQHGTVNHSADEYARWDNGTLHHVNTVESFWKLFKDSIRSTHIHVSPKYLDRYLGEFTFRSNHREMKNAMFDLLLGAI